MPYRAHCFILAALVCVGNADDLCCDSTSYSTDWKLCVNAADANLGSVTSCNTCIAYQCLDWTVGSQSNQARESAFKARSGEDVHFGVGSYGNDQTRAGLCYRISSTSFEKDLIVQAINQGADTDAKDFDLQTGDGGFGLYNGCASGSPTIIGSSVPMYDGNSSQWGSNDNAILYGGWRAVDQCNQLPAYPHCNPGMAQDSLRDLCKWSIINGYRGKLSIQSICNVKCPDELWQATGIHRSDETPTVYTCTAGQKIGNGGAVTNMMDCAKPSYAWADNVKGATFPGYDRVIPCRRDGYTRINAMPLSSSPTISPSVRPTQPTVSPSLAPTKPTVNPSIKPSPTPTIFPTSFPTVTNNTPQPTDKLSTSIIIASCCIAFTFITCCLVWVYCINPRISSEGVAVASYVSVDSSSKC